MIMRTGNRRHLSEPNKKLSWVDRFKWINAYLFIAAGAVMIYRTYTSPAAWLGTLTGVAFLIFGIYRLRLIHRTLDGNLHSELSRRKGIVGRRS